MHNKVPVVNANDKPTDQRVYHCGTLTYTHAGLIAVFGWLLWGDFCYNLMEHVVPSVMPLKLKSLGCANWLIGLVMTTVPSMLNMTICPYVSFKSDRFRSRWGRRIPFIVGTMPFLCVSLVLIGCTDDISATLRQHSAFLQQFAPTTLTVALIAVFIAMFQFFNMFVSSVFSYLFNDVVPPQFLARFTGMFRIVSGATAAMYNFFIFRFAESHMREIFLGAAFLYFFGFGLMCLMVKEGRYPALQEAETQGQRASKFGEIRRFFNESFTHKIYWFVFMVTAIGSLGGAIGTFNIFFNKHMGLSLEQIGSMNAITGLVSLVGVYLASMFIDRWHPVRVSLYVLVFAVVGNVMSWKWLFISLPGTYFFWLTLGVGIVNAFAGAISLALGMPLFYRVLPRSRFGQFCSAQALVRSCFGMVASVLAGLYIDAVRCFCQNPDYAYRFIFVWQTLGSILAATAICLAYREWHRLGGADHYHPPATWDPRGYEEMPFVATVGPQSRWLEIAFKLYHAIMAISVIGFLPLMVWMYHQQAMVAFTWHAWLLLPLAMVAWVYWAIVEKAIHRDMDRVRQNEPLLNGIPHHGVCLIVAGKFLFVLLLWFVQVVVALHLKMEVAAIIFTAANILTDFLLVVCLQVLCRVERGVSMSLDQPPARD